MTVIVRSEDMSYDPYFFGPPTWMHMHIMAASATTKRKIELYVQWLNGLTETLPCEKCRLHFIENLKLLPVEPYANNNVSLFFHSWKLHDTVNKQTHKAKHLQMSYEDAFEKFFGKPKPMSTNTNPELGNTSNAGNNSDSFDPGNAANIKSNIRPEFDEVSVQASKKPSAKILASQPATRTVASRPVTAAVQEGETCQEDCGKTKHELQKPKDFESFRLQQRRFYTKNT